MFKKWFSMRGIASKSLGSQRGAMFSMDARIALIIASVLAGVVGTQVIQRIERNRVAAAEEGVQQLFAGLENYYKTVALDTIPPGNPDTFNTGTDNFESVILDQGLVAQDNLNTDPWGNVWTYETCNRPATIEGLPVTVHHVVLFSHGPDGVADSGTGDILTSAGCAGDYAGWATANDDIGAKFSTFDIERERVEITRERLNAIRESLSAYESTRFMEAQEECVDGAPLAECDFDNSGGHNTGEEVNYNFFPRSTNDGTWSGTHPDDYYYIPDGRAAVGSEMNVVLNSLASMQSFVSMLGLNNEYAVDPWGRTLCYESNVTGVDSAPFTVRLEYRATCP